MLELVSPGPPALHRALYRLLHDASYRAKLEQGRWSELDLPPEDVTALRTVDTNELAALSRKLRDELLAGQDGDTGLLRSFPRTFAELARVGLAARDVVERFTADPHYERYRLLPYGGRGVSVEEAFHDFVVDLPAFRAGHPANAALADHELLAALVRLLVINQDPAFDVGAPTLHRRGRAWVALAVYDAAEQRHLAGSDAAIGELADLTYLYAATARSAVCGPVAPVVGAIVRRETAAAVAAAARDLADAHATTVERIELLARRLAALGVIDDA